METQASYLSTFVTYLLGFLTANFITHYFFGW